MDGLDSMDGMDLMEAGSAADAASMDQPCLKTVSPELAQARLDRCVRALFGVSWNQAREWIARGKIFRGETRLTDEAQIPGAGDLEYRPHVRRADRAPELDDDAVLACTPDYVVVAKPAGLITIPFDEQHRDSLEHRVRAWLEARERRAGHGGGRPTLGVVHRLDQETSGLVVFARSTSGKHALDRQFRAHTVHRQYEAVVLGQLREARCIESHLVEDRGDGLRGSRERIPERLRGRVGAGQRAVTHITPLEVRSATSRVACRLETGRTHQIRIHLSEAGHPVVGDAVYQRDWRGPRVGAARLLLHASELGFEDPANGQEVRWRLEAPREFALGD